MIVSKANHVPSRATGVGKRSDLAADTARMAVGQYGGNVKTLHLWIDNANKTTRYYVDLTAEDMAKILELWKP